jgi:hypothetical protein
MGDPWFLSFAVYQFLVTLAVGDVCRKLDVEGYAKDQVDKLGCTVERSSEPGAVTVK